MLMMIMIRSGRITWMLYLLCTLHEMFTQEYLGGWVVSKRQVILGNALCITITFHSAYLIIHYYLCIIILVNISTHIQRNN